MCATSMNFHRICIALSRWKKLSKCSSFMIAFIVGLTLMTSFQVYQYSPVRFHVSNEVQRTERRVQTIQIPHVHNFDCSVFWNKNVSKSSKRRKMAVIAAKTHMERYRKTPISDELYKNFTNDCDSFKKSRGYVVASMTSSEEEFPLAFSLVVYKDVEQIERLLRSIYRPQNVYCVHVDVKMADSAFNALTSVVNCFDNVFILSKRYDVRWGDPVVMLPDILCMKELLKHRIKWKYFVNLAGQEFPLKTNGDLVKIFKAFNGANDIEGTVKRSNPERWQKSVKTGKSKGPPPYGVQIFKGNMHIAASREFVHYVMNDVRSRTLFDWLGDTYMPEEQYLATLQHNPKLGAPGAYTGSNPETRYRSKPYLSRFFVWGSGDTVDPYYGPCYGKVVRSVCVMGVENLFNLVDSRREFFVNKLYLDYDYLTLDCLEQWLFEQMQQEYSGQRKFEVFYYENLDFVRHCNRSGDISTTYGPT